MNRKMISCLAFAVSTLTAAAIPEIRKGSVSMEQDSGRTVNISYTLDNAPAVITVDIRTNGVALTGALLQGRLSGAVNRKVEPGTHAISWQPDGDPRISGDRDWSSSATVVVTAWPTNSLPTWMVVDLTKENAVEFYPDESWFPEPVTSRVYKTDKLVMRKIPAANVIWRLGSFYHGIIDEKQYWEYGRNSVEVARPVMLTEDYYIGVYEVTQAQYAHIKKLPSMDWTDDSTLPAVNVRWKQELRATGNVHYFWPTQGHDVAPTSFMGLMREHTGGIAFDLPTEAQWEIACRAGEMAAFNNGCMTHTNAVLVNEVAWTSNNSAEGYTENRIHPVGLKKPNRWGLYDMHGNACEWCLDLCPYLSTSDDLVADSAEEHAAYLANTDLVVDPVGPLVAGDGRIDGGERSIVKGGAFNLEPNYARSAYRYNPGRWGGGQRYGFRLCAPAAIP